MSYKYLIGIRLATPDSSIALNQEPFSNAILSAIEEYNSCSKSAPNPKNISLIPSNFFNDSFIIKLTSEKELASPGKALRLFSQIITNSGTFDCYIKNGKVFSTFPVMQTENELEILDPDKISDAEILKALIDYVCNKSDSNSTTYKRKRSAMAQIKQIALESGIYTINYTS